MPPKSIAHPEVYRGVSWDIYKLLRLALRQLEKVKHITNYIVTEITTNTDLSSSIIYTINFIYKPNYELQIELPSYLLECTSDYIGMGAFNEVAIAELSSEELAALKLTYLLYRLHKYLHDEENELCPLLRHVNMNLRAVSAMSHYTFDTDAYDMIEYSDSAVKIIYPPSEEYKTPETKIASLDCDYDLLEIAKTAWRYK